MQDSINDRKLRVDVANAAEMIRNADDVLIVSHIDADGITAASIAATTCQRLGKKYKVSFAKKMDEATIDLINSSKKSLVWITDLGGGYLSSFKRNGIVITDHHVPDTKWQRGQTFLDNFISIVQVNPHLYGMDGSTDICGAGTTYLVSKEINPSNTDLAHLAVVGACGDIQDVPGHGLTSLNKPILMDAVNRGDVEVVDDLRLFGRETRTLVQFLQYSNDPRIPGFSENSFACSNLYSELGIPVKVDGTSRVWNDLSDEEKKKVIERIVSLIPPEDRILVYGKTYILPRNPHHSELRDAKEYSTLLNACGRYDDAETGLRICMGDLTAIDDAKRNRVEHRKNISSALAMVKDRNLVQIYDHIQYFNAGSEIKETVVGIVAGMILSTDGFHKDLPIIAFADADDGVKVSARADRSLIRRGLDLSDVMRIAANVVGGYGGGHNVAAGATIPKGTEMVFLDAVNDIVCSQVI